ncbi:DEAD/DEAH box helicase [Ruixingdingia sedimenti]|uniref:DEAD/DEAH box helicase n=1 Tax=Ruixingdingia sedimenti TaxID=3073604 RepID=A0ABU1F9U2_9RHOB|nr:DEAD/DEAH box helicase [Xinfangfangia sp. LG-4]MDR5653617.1 DEAD/DEAH box helicase [Xinfangfangia sp. LG-4]
MTITDGIAPPLAGALAAKGYDTLTPVQEAVLTPDCAGRDLLVSAQTGSGKTVAFGLAIAPELIGTGGPVVSPVPLALIVAPTRELALQVRREVEWLYAETGAQVASCVGGMDWRTERRALERGAAIVVGTPGRLRDHIERGTLDLSETRAVVLDEADEMLDLGFREDLEFILSAAPETRRTLMFSATVPKAIEELARDFQKDALRVVAQGESRQHVDIEYRAMNVAQRDKENAVLNLLRLHEAQVAIVFCKTRATVTHLLARMGNRGFPVVALSGELSQSERSHALQALRDGRARVCIATDVAARGIDLPGLELVVHFDLPTNPETLLHRSGRTGRAGAKGVSMLVVTPSDVRKAQRVLQGAQVQAEWVKPPSAEEVQAADDTRLINHDLFTDPPGEEEAPMVEAILGMHGPEGAALCLLRLWRAGRSAPEVVDEIAPPSEPAPRRERAEFGPSVWYELSVGHTGRAEARWLLPKICEAGGIARDSIGAIRVQQDRTFVQIAAPVADRFAPPGSSVDLDEGLTMARIEGEPTLERPERAPRHSDDRPRKPYKPREEGERKPYAPREDRKPYAPREDGERKPYTPREDRKPYTPREDGERKDRKPYTPREDGERKPYTPRKPSDAPQGLTRKPAGPKTTTGERKPYTPRDRDSDGEKRPYTPRKPADAPQGLTRKPYPKAAEGGDSGAPRKARWSKDGAEKRTYDNPVRTTAPKGADARPARAKPAYAKPAAPKPAPAKPNFADPSQSLRKPRTPTGGKPAPRGKPGPKRG